MLAKREIPSNAINYDMCKICPNPCCLYMPCEYLPSDFVEPKMDAIEQVILNNLAIIDSKFLDFENKFIYYLRARTIYEDLNTMDCLGKKDIYLAKETREAPCLHYKQVEKDYYGVEYAKYDEKKLRALTTGQLVKLFRLKGEQDNLFSLLDYLRTDSSNESYQLIITRALNICINDYLRERAQKYGGGCLLTEQERPGGGLFIVPDLREGKPRCYLASEYHEDDWSAQENQDVLKKILDKVK